MMPPPIAVIYRTPCRILPEAIRSISARVRPMSRKSWSDIVSSARATRALLRAPAIRCARELKMETVRMPVSSKPFRLLWNCRWGREAPSQSREKGAMRCVQCGAFR